MMHSSGSRVAGRDGDEELAAVTVPSRERLDPVNATNVASFPNPVATIATGFPERVRHLPRAKDFSNQNFIGRLCL
jgi:hypothetical protein